MPNKLFILLLLLATGCSTGRLYITLKVQCSDGQLPPHEYGQKVETDHDGKLEQYPLVYYPPVADNWRTYMLVRDKHPTGKIRVRYWKNEWNIPWSEYKTLEPDGLVEFVEERIVEC